MNEDKHSPMVGYTKEEMATVIGYAVIHELEEQGMEIIWRQPRWVTDTGQVSTN